MARIFMLSVTCLIFCLGFGFAEPIPAAITAAPKGIHARAPNAAATSISCSTYRQSLTKTLKFDNIPTNSPIPDPYNSIYFTDFSVVDVYTLLSYYGGTVVAPASGRQVARNAVYPVGSAMRTYNTIWGTKLKSFYLACMELTANGYAPRNCTLELISVNPDLEEYPNIRTTSYNYVASQNMTKFTTEVVAQSLYFALTAGTANTFWMVDDMVVVIENPKCLR